MKRRFVFYRRKLGGVFYIGDTETRKQESLGTKDRAEATSLLNARNEFRPPTAIKPPNRQGASGGDRFGGFKTDLTECVRLPY